MGYSMSSYDNHLQTYKQKVSDTFPWVCDVIYFLKSLKKDPDF